MKRADKWKLEKNVKDVLVRKYKNFQSIENRGIFSQHKHSLITFYLIIKKIVFIVGLSENTEHF